MKELFYPKNRNCKKKHIIFMRKIVIKVPNFKIDFTNLIIEGKRNALKDSSEKICIFNPYKKRSVTTFN